MLEILKYGDYKPLEKPDAETPSYCRYKILLNPGNSVKKFTFKTYTDLYIQITSLNQTDIDAYFKNKLLTLNDKKKIEGILEANLDLHIKEEALKRISSEIDKNFKNQARIRENILIVRDDMKMREDYLNKFKETEVLIEQLKKELMETKIEIEKIKAKLMAMQ